MAKKWFVRVSFILGMLEIVSLKNVQGEDAKYDLAVLPMLTLSTYHLSPNLPYTTTGGRAFGLAVLGAYTFYPNLAAEIGIISNSRKFLLNGPYYQTVFTYAFVEVPLLLRYTFSNDVFVQFGPYFAFPTSITSEANHSFSESLARPHIDMGVRVSVGTTYAISDRFAVRGQMSYSIGFANLSTGLSNQYSRNLDILFGLTVFMLPSSS